MFDETIQTSGIVFDFILSSKFVLHITLSIGEALWNLVPFAQLKKRENTHGGVILLLKF